MPLSGKSTEEIQTLEELLLNNVPESGKAIGNKSLREILHWDDDLYFAVRLRLLDSARLETGKGKGGSVRRIAESIEPVDLAQVNGQAQQVDIFSDEAALYEPMALVASQTSP